MSAVDIAGAPIAVAVVITTAVVQALTIGAEAAPAAIVVSTSPDTVVVIDPGAVPITVAPQA